MAAKKAAAPKTGKAPEAARTDKPREVREVLVVSVVRETAQTYRDYHAGDFQKIDPITGEKRDLNQPVSKVDEV